MAELQPVVFVMVVGFHHQYGPQVDFCYPPLPRTHHHHHHPEAPRLFTSPTACQLPLEWKYLPFLALPDGVHNLDRDFTYFLLPPCAMEEMKIEAGLFGVSCYRHLPSDELAEKSADVTRNHVQKSVVILSRLPLFGVIRAKVEVVADAYFFQKNFNQIEILQHLYSSLNQTLTSPLEFDAFYLGTSPRALVHKFKKKLLTIFKLLLLEHRVVIYGLPAAELCTVLISLLSLFPGLLSNLSVASEPELGSETDISDSYDLVSDSREAFNSFFRTKLDHLAFNTGLNYSETPKDRQKLETWHKLGLPLRIFEKGCLFQPYFSLMQLDQLSRPEVRSFVIGVSNKVFLQQRKIHPEVYIDVGTGNIEYLVNEELFAHVFHQTGADRQFIMQIVDAVEKSWTPNEEIGSSDELSSWEGSNGWVRQQFELYISSLLSSVLKDEISRHPTFPRRESTSSNNSIPQKQNDPPASNNLLESELIHQLSRASVENYQSNFISFDQTSAQLADFNLTWVRFWKQTQNYSLWRSTVDEAALECDQSKGHPCHSEENFFELRAMISDQIDDLGVITAPLQEEVSKAVTGGTKILESAFGKTAEIASSGLQTVNSRVTSFLGSWWTPSGH